MKDSGSLELAFLVSAYLLSWAKLVADSTIFLRLGYRFSVETR